MGQLCTLSIVFALLLTSLAMSVLALLTDYWYRVSTTDTVSQAISKHYNYHFGLWRMCYDYMPEDVASHSGYQKEGSCIFIYEDLIKKNEGNLPADIQLRLHLSRTTLGCSIAGAAGLLFAVLTLMCGVWPSRHSHKKRGCVYLTAASLLILAVMSNIASGISFIAIRDQDNTVVRTTPVMPPVVPAYVSQEYAWSFIVHWIATSLAFLDSFLLISMMKSTYQLVDEDSK